MNQYQESQQKKKTRKLRNLIFNRVHRHDIYQNE